MHLFLLAFLLMLPLPAREILRHADQQSEKDQVSFEGRGYAVQYELPESAPKWYATEVHIFGELYGQGFDPRKTQFTLGFMDLQGNVFAESQHTYGHYFSDQSAWAYVKIQPVELPPIFWVVADFKPTPDRGVYIGFADNGGGHSKLKDPEYRLYPLEEAWDFAIRVKVQDQVFDDDFVPYDPDHFIRRAGTEEVVISNALEKKSAKMHFSFTDLKPSWGDALLTLVERVLFFYEEKYGLAGNPPIRIEARVESGVPETRLAWREDGTLEWVLRQKSDLLPPSRGGEHRHLFGFCRALAQHVLREGLAESRFGPSGQEDAVSAMLAGAAVRDLFVSFGKNFWPVPYDFHQEEGPNYVSAWIEATGPAEARQYGDILARIRKKVGDGKTSLVLRQALEGRPRARDLMLKLYQALEAMGKGAWAEEFFTPAVLDPPLTWLQPPPDFSQPAIFAGLNPKRNKEYVYLRYNDSRATGEQLLGEESVALFFPPPEGDWRIEEVRAYLRREGDAPEERLKVLILDEKLGCLGSKEVPVEIKPSKKGSWVSLGGFAEPLLDKPFYLAFESPGHSGTLGLGLAPAKEASHSIQIKPGSHVSPSTEPVDFMVRLFLAPAKPMDKKALDRTVSRLRRRLKP